MSRMMRADVPNRGFRPRQFSQSEVADLLRREIKRRAIADGHIEDPATRPPKWGWSWKWICQGEAVRSGKVYANTRGEARSLIKRVMGKNPRERLSFRFHIQRFDPKATNANPPSST